MRATIKTVDGPQAREVLAKRNGCAITRAPIGERGWSITHLASGTRIGPLSLLPLSKARLAFALCSSLGNWDDVRYGGHIPDHVGAAVGAISEMIWSR